MNKIFIIGIGLLLLAIFIYTIVTLTSKKEKYDDIENFDNGYDEPPSHEDIFGKEGAKLRKKISDIMNKFSPIYNLHVDEKYYPAPYDTIIENMKLFKVNGINDVSISKELIYTNFILYLKNFKL